MTHNARHRQLQGIADTLYECAQTISATPPKSSMFTRGFETCDGSKNRRLRQWLPM